MIWKTEGLSLLALDGADIRHERLDDRRGKLGQLLGSLSKSDKPPPAGLRLSEHLDGDGAVICRAACKLGCEGIVSKRHARALLDGLKDSQDLHERYRRTVLISIKQNKL